MTPVLWHIELSHYNEKARWALDHKGVAHVRKAPLPGLHGAYAAALTRGGQRRLPVLKVDGTAIGDSTAIIAWLEEHRPDPPLYPADPAKRARALELEDYFDEELGPRVRRFVWFHTLPDARGTAESLLTQGGERQKRAMAAVVPLFRPLVKLDFGVDADGAAEARAGIVAAMDHLESELGSGDYLVGDSFTVADLAAAAMFTPLLRPPERDYLPDTQPPPAAELREELTPRPGGQYVHEMYARHRGASAEVAA
ncbi:MAG: glutathione S-transferase family protein [Thermoleophilaceae bacterium]|nr:glutathione S-transferase family protein [Thermoleophilaceae bacterium]